MSCCAVLCRVQKKECGATLLLHRTSLLFNFASNDFAMALATLGAVSSGFAVASFAGGTVTTIFKLKQLLDKIQNVPESIRLQLEYLEPLPLLIAEMEEAFRQSPEAYASIGTSQKCLDFLQKILNILNTTVQKLEADLASGSKVKRNKAKIKAVLKADAIQEHYQRLGMAIQMFNLCILVYNTSLFRTQPDVIVAKIQATEKQQAVVEEPVSKAKCNTGSLLPFGHVRDTSSLLKWQTPGVFGSVQYSSKTRASPYETHQKSVLRLQLPWWLACKAWDFYVQHAISGWHIGFRPISIIRDQHQFDRIFRWGSTNDLRKALSQKGYSIHDRDESGRTVLHMAINRSSFHIALDLVQAGVSLSEPDKYGHSPFSRACQGFGSARTTKSMSDRVFFFQQLAVWEKLIELADLPTRNGQETSALKQAMWTDIQIYDLIVATLRLDAPLPVWETIVWNSACPATVLAIFQRHGFPNSTEFVHSCSNVMPAAMSAFVWRYFEVLQRYDYSSSSKSGNLDGNNDWRKICRLVLPHVPLTRLSTPETDYSQSPLVKTLNMLMMPDVMRRNVVRHSWKELHCWLQDLQTCGVDIEAYGKAEKFLLVSENRRMRSDRICYDGASYWPAMICDLDYGPNPEDWVVHIDYFRPEYVKEFWQRVDPEPIAIPGSWVDD